MHPLPIASKIRRTGRQGNLDLRDPDDNDNQGWMYTKARMIMLNVLSHLHGTSNSMVTKLTLRTIEIGCFLT